MKGAVWATMQCTWGHGGAGDQKPETEACKKLKNGPRANNTLLLIIQQHGKDHWPDH